MTSPAYAYGPSACRQRELKARLLARWCYARGIGPAIARQPAPVLRAAARQAAVSPPHLQPDGTSPTWLRAGELLRARAAWDRAHGKVPPDHVRCIACAVLQQPCSPCAQLEPALCVGCGGRLDQVLVDERLDLHPTCSAPAVRVPAGHGPAGHGQGRLLELDQRT